MRAQDKLPPGLHKKMKEMEERARRRQQQQSDGREGVASGEMVSYLASSVQPVLAQALLELDQEQPRPAEVAAALPRVGRGPEELRSAPPARRRRLTAPCSTTCQPSNDGIGPAYQAQYYPYPGDWTEKGPPGCDGSECIFTPGKCDDGGPFSVQSPG